VLAIVHARAHGERARHRARAPECGLTDDTPNTRDRTDFWCAANASLLSSIVNVVSLPVGVCALFSVLRTWQLVSSIRKNDNGSLGVCFECWIEFVYLICDILAICAAVPCLLCGVRAAQLALDCNEAWRSDSRIEREWRCRMACATNFILIIPSLLSAVAGIIAGASIIRTYSFLRDLVESRTHWTGQEYRHDSAMAVLDMQTLNPKP